MRKSRLKQLLAEGKPAIGTWLTLDSITAARSPRAATRRTGIAVSAAAACTP